jgi:molybdenum cofactor synthesis domain-containing protein
VIGNEILNGSVQDTNSRWLAQQLYELGFNLRRITAVRDDPREIVAAIRQAAKRGARWIFTSGGLGPTYDDITLDAVAKAINKKLVVNEEALAMLKERYEKLAAAGIISSAELTPARIKMAIMPKGARPLRNNAGSAPGCLVKYRRSLIVSLPGVPAELIDIFQREVRPLLEMEKDRVQRIRRWIDVKGVPESLFAPQLEAIYRSLRGRVYIKSHPRGFEDGLSVITLEIIAEHSDREKAEEWLGRAEELLAKALEKAGAREVIRHE